MNNPPVNPEKEASTQPVEGDKQLVKPDCAGHKKEVATITDMKVLAEMIGDLHYEALSQFLFELQTKLHNDSMKDLSEQRFKLAHHLRKASHFVYEASNEIGFAWNISKPLMKTEVDKNNNNGK